MSSLGVQVRDWHRGVQAVARGDWDCALRLFSGVLQPPAKICFNVGCVHLMAGDPEAALRAFDQAVTKDTCMAVGFLQRGVANFQLERFQEAVSDFQLALTQLRGNTVIDYTQLGLHFKLQAWELLYNMASAQCQAGLWTKAANTLEEAISKWPEGAKDNLNIALNQVQKQVPLKLWQVPRGEVFWPPRQHLKYLEPMDFLGKAKVVAPPTLIINTLTSGLNRGPKWNKLAVSHLNPQGCWHLRGLAQDPLKTLWSWGSSGKGPRVPSDCHCAVPLYCNPKGPKRSWPVQSQGNAGSSPLSSGAGGAAQLPSFRRGEALDPCTREESLQSMWRDVAMGPRGLQLQCRGAGGRPVLYQVVALHDYSSHRPEDLDFHQGDTVDVLCEVDEAWLEGHRDGRIGIFPKCFVVPVGACEGALPALGPQPGEQH